MKLPSMATVNSHLQPRSMETLTAEVQGKSDDERLRVVTEVTTEDCCTDNIAPLYRQYVTFRACA